MRRQLIVRPLDPLPRFVAGADVAFSEDKKLVLAVALVYDRVEQRVVEVVRVYVVERVGSDELARLVAEYALHGRAGKNGLGLQVDDFNYVERVFDQCLEEEGNARGVERLLGMLVHYNSPGRSAGSGGSGSV